MPATEFDTRQLNQFFHSFLPDDLASSQRNGEAFANDVYNLTDTSGRRYVMRILKTQLPETIATEALMQQRLTAAGIGSPLYLKTSSDDYIGEAAAERYTLSRWIDGQAPRAASPELIKDFGATLARMHDSFAGIELPNSRTQWLNPVNAQRDLNNYAGPLKSQLAELLDAGPRLLELGLPTTVIHGDFWIGNVFADDNKITTVFDLETAENTARIIDLARTYLSMRLEKWITETKDHSLFTGYDSAATRPLTAAEKANFDLAAAYVGGVCAAWHTVHGTRYGTRYIGPYLELGQAALKRFVGATPSV